MEQNQNNIIEEQEIDLVELIQRMWHNRGLIVKTTIVFMVVGLLVALFSPKVYTASCDIVPQTSSSSSSNSQMTSLARLAGINIPPTQSVQTLSPYVYENILRSTKFKKELMQTVIAFQKAPQPMSFYDYYTSEEYNKPSVMDYVLKYTIGLPGVIMGAIRGERPQPNYDAVGDDAAIETLTKEEYDVMKVLNEAIALTLDDKKGYVSISVNMPEAMAAAQLAQATLKKLEEYITVFKVEKVQSNLDFVQGRYNEVKREFEDVQARRARYRDANHNTIKNQARIEQERLEAEYQLAMNVYSELAMQLEQAKIKVKETTPILTVINPVTVPYKSSKPKRAMILMAFTVLGAVAGMGCVLAMPTVAEIVGSERLGRVVKSLPEKDA